MIMNETDYIRLREESWRRKLTPAEQGQLSTYLKSHPQAREDWLEEEQLGKLLARLPEAPKVASNFTAIVMEKIRLESAAEARRGTQVAGMSIWALIRRWLPQTAIALMVLGLAGVGYHQRETSRKATLTQNVVEMSEAVSSDPQLLEDFESIRQMGNSQDKADTSLLAMMQ